MYSTKRTSGCVLKKWLAWTQLEELERFLATGDTFKTISFSYRLDRLTVAAIIHSTCKAIVDVIQNEVMPVPDEAKWNTVASEFWEKWQFPNCIGVLDGKHVTIQAPKLSGSLYWNYKHSYSIVLLALVDPCYNFIVVDVGAYGKNSDGGIFLKLEFWKSSGAWPAQCSKGWSTTWNKFPTANGHCR
ncbi:uncharacterized protein LOC124169578 [Ischnura elegans]|uniref:uncharacterized protein LOC124169578 n=1 Tax=Ischnura elegans TaxID=197161 RepID=UPI001ED8B57D|nr:uncharacterized protein LOC124169578 [Ischnura elegans]